MALRTDDIDIRDVRLHIDLGGNGDYYLVLTEMGKDVFMPDGKVGITNVITNMRISTSGGYAPTNVKLAIAQLYRALEESKLNGHPFDEPYDRFG